MEQKRIFIRRTNKKEEIIPSDILKNTSIDYDIRGTLNLLRSEGKNLSLIDIRYYINTKDSHNKIYILLLFVDGSGRYKIIGSYGPNEEKGWRKKSNLSKSKGQSITKTDAYSIFRKAELDKSNKGYILIQSFTHAVIHLYNMPVMNKEAERLDAAFKSDKIFTINNHSR